MSVIFYFSLYFITKQRMENLNYGIIGNCKCAALISEQGSIDWCCLPEFNSSSVFARILDDETGGSFEILTRGYTITQSYINNTNILVTKFTKGDNKFELVDFMPRYLNGNNSYYTPPDMIRFLKYISGKPIFRIKYQPRLEYAKNETRSEVKKDYIKSSTSEGTYDSLYLYTSLDKEALLRGEEITLTEDEFCLVSYNQKILEQTVYRSYLKMERTKVYWLNWTERIKKYARYNAEIARSALVLKLLSHDKTGAIIAALTTSLPEIVGGERNWDYRFCWLRDSAMVTKILTELGQINVAKRYVRFILDIIPDKDEKIQIMYGIHGERQLTEKILPHLKGYMSSAPVRIGNAAYKQKQNDIYGVLMDMMYQQFKIFENTLEHSESLWTITRSIVKTVSKNWRKPDRGIWELRHEPKHFTFSKVLCWVAVDRGIKIAGLINMHGYVKEWMALREEIREDINENAWNEQKKSFTQVYHGEDLDASILLLEPYGFLEAKDPMYVSTVKAIEKELCYKGLMFRYKNNDDFGQPKSSFTICSFWLINALFKIGEQEKAEIMFESLLSHSNHLGLFSEDIDFDTRRLLGNFPQAYSHLALIETAIQISEGKITQEEKIRKELS